MRKKKWILTGLFILCLAAACTIGGIFLHNASREKAYQKQLDMGNKYLEEMDYENALLAFELALEEIPEKEEAYLSLFRLYDLQGEIDSALNILETGSERTEARALRLLLEEYLVLHPRETADFRETTEIKPAITKGDLGDSDVEMNINFFQKAEGYRFRDYEKEFGDYTEKEGNRGALVLTYSNPGLRLCYEDSDEKEVIDPVKEEPYEGAMPAWISVDRLELLFRGYKGALSYERLCSLTGVQARIQENEEAGGWAAVFSYQDCRAEIACDENGNISGEAPWNRILPEQKEEQEKAVYSGVTINAVTGEPQAGIRVRFIPEEKSGEEAAAVTGEKGGFRVELQPGKYQLEISGDGFETEIKEIEVQEEASVSGETILVSPKLEEGEIRIVLSWGDDPEDLDSHLLGNVDGKSFEVYFGNPEVSINDSAAAQLDIDERNGYGPETTTIYRLDGTYHFLVKDYRKTGRIGGCGAEVKVYTSQGTETFQVPEGEGDVWDVFTMENGEIEETGTIY